MKIHTTVTVDEEILKLAKDKAINVSEATENNLKRIVFGKVDAPEEEIKCHFCGRHQERAKDENDTNGLIFLCPYEVWCCNDCLRTEVTKIPIVIGTKR